MLQLYKNRSREDINFLRENSLEKLQKKHETPNPPWNLTKILCILYISNYQKWQTLFLFLYCSYYSAATPFARQLYSPSMLIIECVYPPQCIHTHIYPHIHSVAVDTKTTFPRPVVNHNLFFFCCCSSFEGQSRKIGKFVPVWSK